MPNGLSFASEAVNVRKSLRVLYISGEPMTDGKSTSNIQHVVSYAKYAWDPSSWKRADNRPRWLRAGCAVAVPNFNIALASCTQHDQSLWQI